MFRQTTHALAAGLLAWTTAQAQDEPKIEGDLKTLQGNWISKDDAGESTWTFKGNKLHLKTPGREYKITVRLDSKPKPATIDLDVAEDSPNAKDFKGKGIYKFEGTDKAVICFSNDDSRPTTFEADFQTTFLFNLEKKKECPGEQLTNELSAGPLNHIGPRAVSKRCMR
jgi:uncharacterized protein (TIGR03067 family)